MTEWLRLHQNFEIDERKIGRRMKDMGMTNQRRRSQEGDVLTIYDWDPRKVRKLIRRYTTDPQDFMDLKEIDMEV